MTTEKHKALIALLQTGIPFQGEITLNFDGQDELDFQHEELSNKYQMLVEKFDKLRAVNQALIKERDELLDAATKPPKKKQKKAPQLSNEQVWTIREGIRNKVSDAVIARQLGIKASAVWRIRHGKAYQKVPARPHPSVQPRRPVTAHAGHGIVEQK